MITKDFCTYKRIMLRRDKTLRDHGRAAVRRVAGAHLDLVPLVPGPGTLPHPGHPLWGPQLTILNILTGDLDLTNHAVRMFALLAIAARVAECADIARLEAWADRAATATSLDDIFET